MVSGKRELRRIFGLKEGGSKRWEEERIAATSFIVCMPTVSPNITRMIQSSTISWTEPAAHGQE
jgi:hypothetical protein